MPFEIEKTPIKDVIIVKQKVFEDERGFFTEVYRQDLFTQLGLADTFVQLNHSGSVKNTVRGLHFQYDPPMSKLMRVTHGEAFLIAVDIRKDSPTLGKWFGINASQDANIQLLAPAGCARGFCVLSDFAEVQYLCTSIYNPKCETSILWSDPDVNIDWPVTEPILSEKDKNAQTLAEWLKKEESGSFK